MRPLPLLALLVLLPGCATSDVDDRAADALGATAPARPARINHVVFFKLDDPAQTDALIADCDAKLTAIPEVVSYYCGRHHEVGRPAIDSDYDVGLFVGFMTDDDYAAYVEHPLHVELVQAWRPRLAWLRVHDILDETP